MPDAPVKPGIEGITMQNQDIKSTVKDRYAAVARGETQGRNAEGASCCAPKTSCCGGPAMEDTISKSIGYTDDDLQAVPEGANLGLGCGNPTALAGLQPGETVIDLGAGAGFDCFLAANQVGPHGHVIGIDMTPDMVEKATENAEKGGYRQVEFRLGEIENIPVKDQTADFIISNCVINLSPDKPAVFREAFRVLKPGGRMAVSDIVLLGPLPERVQTSAGAYSACIAGALPKEDYLQAIANAGFENIELNGEAAFPKEYFTGLADPLSQSVVEELTPQDLEDTVAVVRSIKVMAKKPGGTCCCG